MLYHSVQLMIYMESKMKHVLVLGAGNIGRFISLLLMRKYKVTLADIQHNHKLVKNVNFMVIDANDADSLKNTINATKVDVVVSCLPHFLTKKVADVVIGLGKHYFDITEDVATTAHNYQAANSSAGMVVPQCGLAPGFVSIVAQHLMRDFDSIDAVRMRVGALPIHVSNALQYALTWSTDGLINEYIQDTEVLRNGKKALLPALTGLETLKIDGLTYEAFHTSGGVGSLVNSNVSRVKNMDYKTIRYPGHCEKMHFLLKQLHLEQHPDWMKQILENAIPQTTQDMVLIYVSVVGKKDNILLETNYAKKFYSVNMFEQTWSAIQLCTGSSLCAVLDMLLSSDTKSGLVKQESIQFEAFVQNEFGRIFSNENEEALNV